MITLRNRSKRHDHRPNDVSAERSLASCPETCDGTVMSRGHFASGSGRGRRREPTRSRVDRGHAEEQRHPRLSVRRRRWQGRPGAAGARCTRAGTGAAVGTSSAAPRRRAGYRCDVEPLPATARASPWRRQRRRDEVTCTCRYEPGHALSASVKRHASADPRRAGTVRPWTSAPSAARARSSGSAWFVDLRWRSAKSASSSPRRSSRACRNRSALPAGLCSVAS